MRRAPLLRTTLLASILTCAALGGPAVASRATDVPPSDSSATTVAKSKVYTFENGKLSGWKAVGGATVTVAPGLAISGTQSMRVSGLGAGMPAGLVWSRALTAFPGTDPWYRIQVPVRAVSGQAGVPAGTVWMRVKGVSDLLSNAVTVTSDGWAVLEARFVPAGNVTSVTFTVEQAPPVDCGPSAPTLGDVVVDDVVIDRIPDPTATTGGSLTGIRAGAGEAAARPSQVSQASQAQPDCVG